MGLYMQMDSKKCQFIFKFIQNSKIRKMANLQKFKSVLRKPELFKDLIDTVPRFLQTNLVDPARVIKYFGNDPYAFIKVFYFQFFKLCFETQGNDHETKINKFVDLIQEQPHAEFGSLFRFSVYNIENLSLLQTQKILTQFIELLSEGNQLTELSLARYPIIQKILVNFIVNFLNRQGQHNSYNTSSIFQVLCQYFEVNMIEFEECFQFTDTQIYVYKESQSKIYLIYIDEQKAMRNSLQFEQQECSQISEISEEQQIRQVENSDLSRSQILIFQEDQIIFDELKKSKDEVKMNQNDFYKPKILETRLATTAFTSSSQFSSLTNKENNGKRIHNITKQFTNTFILEHVLEPHRTAINGIKAKARAQRKSRQLFFK